MPGPSGPSPRMIGLSVASLMLVVFTIIVWRSIGTVPTTQVDPIFPDDPSEIPDLTELEQGARMLVTIVDRDDPTRVAGTLEADQFEPMGGGQRRLVNPDAWIYMRDGRRVHITADHGLVMMPDPNEAPDSGTLEGDVTIRSFDPPTGDAVSMAMGITDAADTTPSMTAKFDQPVEFERRYQRLTSEGRFTIDSPGLSFIGHDLTVMLNEVKGRVELLDVRKGESLILRPQTQKTQQVTRGPQQGVLISTVAYPSALIEQDAEVPEEASNEQPYHINIKDSVHVDVVGTGTLRADTLDIWAMLVDGSLSADAVKEIGFAQEASPEAADVASEQSQAETVVDQPSAAQPVAATGPEDGEVVMTWDGPLVVRPIEDPSTTMLASEQVAVVFDAEDRVVFNAQKRGVRGSVDSLSYGATTGTLELNGSADQPIELIADDAGTLRTQHLESDLASGVISIDAPGLLESIQATDEPRGRIDWSTSARFGLVKLESGELTDRLQSAYFEGEVIGTQAGSVLRAHSLLATLDTSGPIDSALRTIELNRGSLQSDDGSLTSDSMLIGFAPIFGESGVTPATLEATGAVLGISQDGRVETEALDAVMMREMDGQTRVRRATAIGNTQFLGEDETSASGHQIELDTDDETIHILSAGSELASAGQAGSLIHGSDILINTRSRSILVEGAGSFDHDIEAEGMGDGLASGHLRVTWEESMRFDDAIGAIECNGAVVAVSTPDAYTLDTVKADRLEIDLTPATGTDQITNPDAVVVDDGIERELIEARAFGHAVPGSDPVPASVESRSYDPKNPERAIGVMYLEGSQLIANNRNQTLRVPASGMLVLMDRSEEEPGGQSGADATVMPSTSGPGLTRMTWLGSMELDRASGNALVLNEVNIRHKSLSTGRVSHLGCDRLEASFSGSSRADPTEAITMEYAQASGRVRFSDLQRSLFSDHAIYDAANETLFAFADNDQLVTLRDAQNPTPTSAKTLLWDLKKDLVEIDAPSPVRAPSRP